jgi:hypothetical protein
MAEHLPPELWLEVFSELTLPQEIHLVSLVCKHFCLLAQPLAFQELELTTYKASISPSFPRHISDLEHIDNRLRLYSSEKMAPAVRTCIIRSTPYNDICSDSKHYINPNQILDMFFDALPRFLNVKRLVLGDVDFTKNRVERIQALPGLTSLFAGRGRLLTQDDDITTCLPIENISVHNGEGQWLLMAHQNHTHSIDLRCSTPQTSPTVTLHRLRSLTLPESATSWPSLIETLSQCPSLDELCLTPDDLYTPNQNSTGVLPPGILPVLRKYSGSYFYLGMFSGITTLLDIELQGECSDLISLSSTLSQLSTQVEVVTVPVKYITQEFIENFASFKFLTSLTVRQVGETSIGILSRKALVTVITQQIWTNSIESLEFTSELSGDSDIQSDSTTLNIWMDRHPNLRAVNFRSVQFNFSRTITVNT